jgi:hypothetical protein
VVVIVAMVNAISTYLPPLEKNDNHISMFNDCDLTGRDSTKKVIDDPLID